MSDNFCNCMHQCSGECPTNCPLDDAEIITKNRTSFHNRSQNLKKEITKKEKQTDVLLARYAVKRKKRRQRNKLKRRATARAQARTQARAQA